METLRECGNAQLSFLPFKTERAELLCAPQAQVLIYISIKARIGSHRLLQSILFFQLNQGKEEAEERVFLLQWTQCE